MPSIRLARGLRSDRRGHSGLPKPPPRVPPSRAVRRRWRLDMGLERVTVRDQRSPVGDDLGVRREDRGLEVEAAARSRRGREACADVRRALDDRRRPWPCPACCVAASSGISVAGIGVTDVEVDDRRRPGRKLAARVGDVDLEVYGSRRGIGLRRPARDRRLHRGSQSRAFRPATGAPTWTQREVLLGGVDDDPHGVAIDDRDDALLRGGRKRPDRSCGWRSRRRTAP